MKLIVVTAPTFFVEEDKIITALFEEGLDILHLRKPETPAMYSERLLTLIPEKYHKRIVTHEHFYLQEEFSLMGIHLNARNPNPTMTRGMSVVHVILWKRCRTKSIFTTTCSSVLFMTALPKAEWPPVSRQRNYDRQAKAKLWMAG